MAPQLTAPKITTASAKITFNDDVLVTPEQASELLAIPHSSLQKWRSTGENNIPFVKIGRSVRYRTTDLKTYVERHTKQGVVV